MSTARAQEKQGEIKGVFAFFACGMLLRLLFHWGGIAVKGL